MTERMAGACSRWGMDNPPRIYYTLDIFENNPVRLLSFPALPRWKVD